MDKARFLALKVLNENKKQFVQISIDEILKRESLSPQDSRLLTEILYGIVRYQFTLEHIIKSYSRSQPSQLAIKNCLCIGLYQLLFLDKIPAYAAIHQTVELLKKKYSRKQVSYVNAILRRVQDDAEKVEDAEEGSDRLVLSNHLSWKFRRAIFPDIKDLDQYRSVVYSYPVFLVRNWNRRFAEKAQQLFISGNLRPPILLRMRDESFWLEFEEQLIQQQVDVEREQDVIRMYNSGSITNLPGFTEGKWVVEGTMPRKVVESLSPQPDEKILDVCAAPGGKSFHIADLMQDRGQIVSCDKSADRIKLLKAEQQRLKLQSITTKVLDARNLPAEFACSFDRVLVDVPCSNSGVLARRLEARWRISKKKLEELQTLQLQILESASAAVKPQGILLYSTCSIEPQENSEVVQKFLQKNSTFRCLEEQQIIPESPDVDGGSFAKFIRI